MNIFQKIQELGLADGSYVVVGGGVLVALGLLEWDEDIDLCLTPETFELFRNAGWQQEEWQGKTVLKHGVYDAGIGFGDWSLEQLLDDALHIQGCTFISLQKLRTWKRAMGRPKDAAHITLIEQYLASHLPNLQAGVQAVQW